LGLAIVKHVVQRHDGELDIQSRPNAGSTFTILMPLAKAGATSKPALAEATVV
jgi:two-component system, OmpR family, phosphate regulon sensor histidine kinase PhoR